MGERRLRSLPAFDGLIAAEASLYMVTEDGSVLCYQSR